MKVSIVNNRLLQSADSLKVLSVLRRFLPADKLDPGVELLCQQYDFTSLWLEQLQTRSDQIDPKTIGALLCSGRYEVLDILGSGGQSTTYIALDQTCGETVKEFVLPVAGGREITEEALKRIQAEASIVRILSHPHIVRCLGEFCEGRRAYLVLNHIKGKSLSEHVASQGPMSESDVVSIANQICHVLAYLHHREPPVVHRDLTPDNLMLQEDGTIVLVDFNVAKDLDSLSTTHSIVGKNSYIPPEQFRGHANIQSDIYALGATMFFLLTGQDPEPISISHPQHVSSGVSEWMNHLVETATQQDLSLRFKSVEEISAILVAHDHIKATAWTVKQGAGQSTLYDGKIGRQGLSRLSLSTEELSIIYFFEACSSNGSFSRPPTPDFHFCCVISH